MSSLAKRGTEPNQVNTDSLKLGFALTAGDFNGDTQCDIAASAYNWSYDGDGDDGAVFLYTGIEKTPFSPYGVGIQGRSDSSRSRGRCRFDADGIDELIVGAPYAARGRDNGTQPTCTRWSGQMM